MKTRAAKLYGRGILLALIMGLAGCQTQNDTVTPQKEPLFTKLESNQTGLDFINEIHQDYTFNFLTYQYVYNGGGVSTADFNNDQLIDLYFTSNHGSNKLYLNKGNFEFQDITSQAGVEDSIGWTTGTNIIDINNDGLPDIYVCKSGEIKRPDFRKNKLYLNLGNGKFLEEAKQWNLDNAGYSVQSYFFDFDKDGDLDMYLVNHRPDFQNARHIDTEPTKFDPSASDHLFRNDGNTFANVTEASGIQNSAWGLSASIGDFNHDGWPDIYVANDYIQPDMLYINNKDGTFTDEILDRMDHIPYNSMGSDFADINNDLLSDLIVLDMLAEDHIRGKENMATMDSRGFQKMVESDYHHSYMANMLFLNNGNGTFKEIGQLSGISQTDWSWTPLLADFDNDGWNDLFVSNGILRDLTNQDYRRTLQNIIRSGRNMSVESAEKLMPSHKVSNYIYQNQRNLTFDNKSADWGIEEKVNTNGAAYADLDNDGDLDLILNNQGDHAMVYRNNSTNNYLQIQLTGPETNQSGIGAEVRIFHQGQHQMRSNYGTRGYQSSVSNVLHFGLETATMIDSVLVVWNDGGRQILKKVKANQRIHLRYESSVQVAQTLPTKPIFERIDPKDIGLYFKHQEDTIDDYSIQTLLPHGQSTIGPAMFVADVNGDGLDDVFIGGASNQAAELYIQNSDGSFKRRMNKSFKEDQNYEDQGSVFFDADNDGDLDLFVTSGGYELQPKSSLLLDRLYLNDGQGRFTRSKNITTPASNTKKALAIDFDQDGDLDLVVGGHTMPRSYPLADRSYLLRNDNGHFADVTQQKGPELNQIGIINDMTLSDMDQDGDQDLVIVGEWMPITVLENRDNQFLKTEYPALRSTEGWWQSILAVDINQDGLRDYLVGNIGQNNKFHPSQEKPLHIYGGHLDNDDQYDMFLSKVYKGNLVPVRGKQCSTEQNPVLGQKIKTFEAFANASLEDIYGDEFLNNADHKQVHTFSSILLINKGKGDFKIKTLPSLAQTGPTTAFATFDLNSDGYLDVIGVGAKWDTEVETIRYDGNTGYALMKDSAASLSPIMTTGLETRGNVRKMELITVNNRRCLIVSANGGSLEVFGISSDD